MKKNRFLTVFISLEYPLKINKIIWGHNWNIIFTTFPGRGIINKDIVHTSVRIGVADSFRIVVYRYRNKMIPNIWTFNIITFDNHWNCFNFRNYLKFWLDKEKWPFNIKKWQSLHNYIDEIVYHKNINLKIKNLINFLKFHVYPLWSSQY